MTWQFDRGGEFVNDLFQEWITLELGALQLFSNVEHPWENGRTERSFSTIFQKTRVMLKYAYLPNGIWGKAVMHAVYLKNRCPPIYKSQLPVTAPVQNRRSFRFQQTQSIWLPRPDSCTAQREGQHETIKQIKTRDIYWHVKNWEWIHFPNQTN
jgi:hypothetical protein